METTMGVIVILSFYRYLLNTYYVPDVRLGTDGMAVNKMGQIPALRELTFKRRNTGNK